MAEAIADLENARRSPPNVSEAAAITERIQDLR
jgi:hypothetical protein